MKTERLIQIVVSYSERDGIGSIVNGIHQVAQKKGIQSFIISLVGNAETSDPKLTKLNAFVDDSFNPASDFETQFVYHFGFSNEFMETFILSRIPKNKCFYYHNVTPADFFALWNPPLARQLLKTRSNMKRLLDSPWKITGDSHFNISELRDLTKDRKLPPTIPEHIRLDLFNEKNFERESMRADKASINLLFVGRFVPNKKQDILIYLLYWLRQNDFPAQLTLVGKGGGPYKVFLKILVLILGLKNFVSFKEDLSQNELETEYKNANYLVVSSEHEGFCLPIFESLNRGLLPIARPISAMSELLIGTPVLAQDNSIDSFVNKVAAIIHLTWKKPKMYLDVLSLSYSQVKVNFNSYISADQFLDDLYTNNLPNSNVNFDFEPARISNMVPTSNDRQFGILGKIAKTLIFSFAYLNKQTPLLYIFAIPYYTFLTIRKLFSKLS